MRIFHENKNETIKNILLCLTLDEARELRDSLNLIIKNKSQISHEHINDLDYSHEITITLYDEKNLQGFSSRIVKVIQEDE